MALCDNSVYKFVTNKYYNRLSAMSPLDRSVEIFKLCMENLSFEIKPTDEIFGWFHFNGDRNCEWVVFENYAVSEDVSEIIESPKLHGSRVSVDKGHTLVDYEYIVNNGLVGYMNKIENELSLYPDSEYLSAMKKSLEEVFKLCKKLADFAETEKSYKISEMLKRVPYYSARSFREAIQSIWIIHFLLPLADNAWYSISLGKFDKYLYSFYKNSLSDGMPRDEAKRIMYNFYELLNSYADGACLLNVGDEYNELSELIIQCQSEFAMAAPILGARVSDKTPEKVWNMLIDNSLFQRGQPTFYGEQSCVVALLEKGLDIKTAQRFSNNSCMGISIPGEEFNSMWGCVFFVPAALEAALNCGRLISRDFIVPDIPSVSDVEGVFSAFEKSAEYLLDICSRAYEARAEFSEINDPDPFVSLLTTGCIENHCDRISGSLYHNVTVECMGMVNASDGIYAIDKLVFKDKKYSLEEINLAVKNNFVGFETIKEDLIRCNKFGQNSDADEYAVRVAEILQKIIRSKDNKNRIYSPSLHTLDLNVGDGNSWGAGYDGRMATEPFAKNSGASNCVREKNSTSMILSATKLPQHKFFGGQPLDVNFTYGMVNDNKAEIMVLIKTYLCNGGLQFQVNSVSPDILRDAVKNPENYSDLVVRVGGYSRHFNKLSLKSKYEFIERTEKES